MNESKTNSPKSGSSVGRELFVVDDEQVLLDLAAVVLRSHGYAVRAFRNAEAALEAFAKAQPPPLLVITDYAMHEMTGLALIEECRRLQPRQKTLLISGTVTEHAYRGSAAKPDGFLAKPYRPSQLVDAVRALLADESRKA